MSLVLQIENIDRLADGGPLSIRIEHGTCHVGRGSGMTWVLPDPSRMISGHHFDVQYRDGGYWVTDCSTNGTYLVGNPYRLSQPHRLSHMDRLQVGRYILVALLQDAAPSPQGIASDLAPNPQNFAPAPMPGSWAEESDDPWAVGPALPPVSVQRPAAPRHRDDFASEFIAHPTGYAPPPLPPSPSPALAPPGAMPPSPATPVPASPVPPLPAAAPFERPFAAPPLVAPVTETLSEGPAAAEPAASDSGAAHLTASAFPEVALPTVAPPPFAVPPAASEVKAPPLAAVSTPPTGLPPQPSASVEAGAIDPGFIMAFCSAAGLDPKLAQGLDPATFGRILGETLRGTTDELMAQLKLRAAARKFTRSTDQTMRQATANNPLKFLPGSEQALEAILFRPRAGFLTGAAAVTAALSDIRQHQIAIFAALQPALINLLEDISPDAVEASSGSKGFLANARKSKAWEIFVERWDAKAHKHENGMLDEFLRLFAESYDEALRRQRSEGPDQGA